MEELHLSPAIEGSLSEKIDGQTKEGITTHPLVTKEKLLEAGTYFGHKSFMWNPKMKPYIHSKRGNTHIIDLLKTQKTLEFTYDLIHKLVLEKNASFIFVGTRHQASETIKENALRANAFYVNERWLGGTLTNHSTIQARVYRLLQLEKMKETNFEGYTKKEAIQFQKELDKLDKNLSGIRNMKKLPNIMIVADPLHDKIAVLEAKKKGIKVFGIVDTNVDPGLVDVIIPANDDSKKSVTLIITLLADAIVQAKGGDPKFAFKSDAEIVLPIEPKKVRPQRDFRGEDRFRRPRNDEQSEVRENERQEREAQAGQAQIETMDEIDKLTVRELKEKARQKEVKKYSTMGRHELIAALKEQD